MYSGIEISGLGFHFPFLALKLPWDLLNASIVSVTWYSPNVAGNYAMGQSLGWGGRWGRAASLSPKHPSPKAGNNTT